MSDLRGTLYNQMEHKQSLRDFERDQKQREVELRKKKVDTASQLVIHSLL